MKTTKTIIILLLLTLIITPISSIGFEYHIFEIRTSPEFSRGVFPTSLLYQFNFPVPNIKETWKTEINFRIDNGLKFKTLRQEPNTGIPFSSIPDNVEWNYPTDYISIYSEMNIVFGQGFFTSPLSNENLLKLWTTVDLRFENSYEDFDYLKSPNDMEGLFHMPIKEEGSTKIIERFPDCNWIGQPELRGNRSTSNLSISLGLDINLMQDKITRRNGMKYSLWTRLSPKSFDVFNSATEEYFLIDNKLDLSFTPFYLKMKGSRDTSWFSIVLDNSFSYRYITGNMIPEYIQGGYIFGAQALNTKHKISNRTSITLYGPQINSYDCYPLLSGFFDIAYSCGTLLNSSNNHSYNDMIMSTGFKAEFIIFDIANIYYEFGYIIDNTLNLPSSTISRFGFSFGV